MGITFQGFFSVEIKDAVRSVAGAKYDQPSKSWRIQRSEREALIDAVGALCIQQDVKISDIPQFIADFQANPIPLGASKLGKEMNYKSEIHDKDKTIDKLPEKMMKALYEFQKKGIEYGIQRFGRMLLGDEMGVGKTI